MNESGFRPPLCTYRLNWARRASWGWWDDWDDTVLQTQDSKFAPWRSEAEHATSRSRRLPTILTFTRGWGRNIFCFFQTAETGNRTPNSGVKGNVAYHYPTAPALIEVLDIHTKHTVLKRSAAIGAMRLSPWAHDGTSACFSGNGLTAGALSWRRARFVAWANQNEAWRSLATRQWNYQNYIKKCI